MGVTITEGANASPPDGTTMYTESVTGGEVAGVLIGWKNGSTFTPIGDTDGIPVYGDTTITDLTVSSTNTPVSIGDATSSTEVIAANANRKGWTLTNMSSAVCYVKFGSGASSTSFHARLAQYDRIGQRIMDGDLYTGAIYAIWASDAGGTINGGDW